MSFKEFFEDLKFEGEKPATKRAFWLTGGIALIALVFTLGISGIFVNTRRDVKTLAREQLKSQYILRALCKLPENKTACEKGLSDIEYDKD